MNLKPESRKQEITRIAATLFKQKGYSAVTMRDLASEMGIKAASLYNHIRSKQEILQNIIITIAEGFTEGMALIQNKNKSSIKKLEALIQLHIKIATENPNELAALNSDWMHLENQLDYYLALRNSYEDNFRTIIKEGIENGELKPVDVEVVLFSMLSTLRNLYLWIPKKEILNTNQLSENLYTVLIKGINT